MEDQIPQIIIKHSIGNTINIANNLEIRASTFLSANVAIGDLLLPVDNASDFSTGAILVQVTSTGFENSEILVATSHTTNAITIPAAVFAHNRGDSVSEVRYDRVEIYKSATKTGTYVLLGVAPRALQITQSITSILDTAGLSTDYYKVRWYNSASSAYSDFTDPVGVESYPDDSVASILFPTYKAMGISENDTIIDIPFGITSLNEARKYVGMKMYGVRQAWQQVFEYPIQLLAGTNYVELPDDVDFSESDRSVLAARFLVGNVLTPYNLRYIDKRSWNQIAFSVMGGTTSVLANIGATSLTLNSVGDFPSTASGVAYVATTDYTQTIMQIAYTSIDLTTNQLLGVTGITRDIPIGTRVWSRPTISQPIYYTVYNNRLYFDRIIPDSMQGTNVYIDYYKKLDEITTLDQVLDEHYREIYKFYLRYAVKYRKDLNLGQKYPDPDYKKFEELIKVLYDSLYTGQDTTVITG